MESNERQENERLFVSSSSSLAAVADGSCSGRRRQLFRVCFDSNGTRAHCLKLELSRQRKFEGELTYTC